MDEQQLIRAAKRGDVEAFNQLVLRYQDIAFSVAYRILSDHDAAADATQNAFISSYRKLDQFRGNDLKPWLLRIVTNACYDELRRRQRRPTSSLEDLHEVADAPTPDLALHTQPVDPEHSAEQADLTAAIQDCIAALPDDQRVVVVLADVQGYGYQEIGMITGVALGTVKSRLSRARLKLRDCLQAVRELLPASYRLQDD